MGETNEERKTGIAANFFHFFEKYFRLTGELPAVHPTWPAHDVCFIECPVNDSFTWFLSSNMGLEFDFSPSGPIAKKAITYHLFILIDFHGFDVLPKRYKVGVEKRLLMITYNPICIIFCEGKLLG